VLGEQQGRHRLADDIGAPDDHRALADQPVRVDLGQHGHAAARRAGRKRRGAGPERAHILRVEAVHVLGGVDGAQHLGGIDPVRQRQLHQDAMHRRVAVQAVHQRQQLRLGRVVRQAVLKGRHAGGRRLAVLVADIDGACRIVADQHHGEAGPDGSRQRRDLGRDPPAQLRRERLAVDDARSAHACSLPAQAMEWIMRPTTPRRK